MTLQEKINELLNNAIIDAPNSFRTQLTDQILSAFKEVVESKKIKWIESNDIDETEKARIKNIVNNQFDDLLSSLTEEKIIN